MSAMKWAGCLGIGLAFALTACRPGAKPVHVNDEWVIYTETINGVEMALVPPGCFMMGSEGRRANEDPIHEVCFEDPFWIDVYEVTNQQFGSIGCEESSSRPRQPRNCVTWREAVKHCVNRGARLPTEAEWEYAARGPDGLIYTWGNTWNADNVVYGGNYLGQPAEVGSMPGGISWVGALNLGGNIREWVNDWYDEEYYSISPRTNPQGPVRGKFRVVRTNSFGSHYRGFSETSYRTRGLPMIGSSNRGFRCALS